MDAPVTRPWGTYLVLDSGPSYQVKRLEVLPGHRFSLQVHKHRTEDWIVVQGQGWAHVQGRAVRLLPGIHVHVPREASHRLTCEGASPTPLVVIETQSGSYLGEDDIVRIEDDYGRATK